MDAQRGPVTSEPTPPTSRVATALHAASTPGAVIFGRPRALRASGKVLPEHARTHNRALVLQTLYTVGAQSRADVARETGLTRVTISDVVAGLIVDGLVIELGQREDARPGKPATLIDVDRAAFHIIGLDLSEHEVFRGAVVGLEGQIIDRDEVARDGATGEVAVQLVELLVERLLARTSTPVLGIGIGSPGVVDPRGVVRSAPNLGWSDVPLQRRIAARFDLPVHVANDANVAVLAEHSASRHDDLLLVKVGHGVGAGLIIDGRPVVGGAFAAGEIGHVVVGTDGGPRCACGRDGCLEAWLAVPRLTGELAGLDGDAAASARDDILREAGRRLGIVLAPVVGALNLSEVVLSGPAQLLDGALHEAAVDTLRTRMMAEFNRDLRLRMTEHGQDIVLRGAAVMVLSGQLGVS
ncbi:ROK family transcriptional regulator [Agromyces laixinhei]|uniref:ROK family transcriptional regulator n=1 Tax=Agromyces laixinhei TaxID=2585717 RepID=UPI001115C340|nr:ROK family transcriptional regulator [Agromyces laixinhei]